MTRVAANARDPVLSACGLTMAAHISVDLAELSGHYRNWLIGYPHPVLGVDSGLTEDRRN
jgi:hypothetical protein